MNDNLTGNPNDDWSVLPLSCGIWSIHSVQAFSSGHNICSRLPPGIHTAINSQNPDQRAQNGLFTLASV